MSLLTIREKSQDLTINSIHKVLKIAVSTSHVVVGIFLIVYSNIDHINITLPFSLIMCCNTKSDQFQCQVSVRVGACLLFAGHQRCSV